MGDVTGRGRVEQSFEVPFNVRFEIIRGVEAGGRSYTGEEGEHPGTIEDYAGVVVILNDLEQISHIRSRTSGFTRIFAAGVVGWKV